MTSHIRSASRATRLKMAEDAVDNLLDAFKGWRRDIAPNRQCEYGDALPVWQPNRMFT
jgi:hypothetical protein